MNDLCFKVFAPMYNSPGKKDATHAFIPEAKAFCKFYGTEKEDFVLIDNHKSKRWMRDKVLSVLGDTGPYLDGVAFFCHGYKSGIQFGFTKHKDSVNKLARAIHGASWNDEIIVPLYCCSTGRDADRDKADDLREFGGDGGFADELRDALCRAGDVNCRVLAHTTAEHTTKNRNLREFCGNGRPLGGDGGNYVVPRKNREEFRTWGRMLQDKKVKGRKKPQKTTFRYEIASMTTAEIQERVLKEMQKKKRGVK